jgi:mannan endo-1,4-beta-mannosidase
LKYKVRFLWIVALAAVSVFSTVTCGNGTTDEPASWKPPPVTDFMKANSTKFYGDFRFSGSNIAEWRFNTELGEIYSQKEIEDMVTNAVKYTRLRVLRTHMVGSYFEPSIGTYNEKAFKQLDYLLAAASKNNVYLIISLRDYLWSVWHKYRYDPYWYLGGGNESNPNKDAILTNNEAKAAFKNFISHVVNRTNTATGIQYKNDPHVFGWEIINEPHDISELKDFYIEFSNYIKSIDANHMIGASTTDVALSWWKPGHTSWEALKIPQLDFIGVHYYGWPDSGSENYTEDGNFNWKTRWGEFLTDAKTLGKPIIVGEYGFEKNDGMAKLLNVYETIIQMSLDAGCPGVLNWTWGPLGPNGWGGAYGFDIYTNNKEVCDLMKRLAPWFE